MITWNFRIGSKPATFVAAAVFALGFAAAASADLQTTFELDGNATTQNANPGLPDDWDRVNVLGTGHQALSTGVLVDPSDSTRFTIGSKDINDIDTWSWDNASSPDKDEITNAYAALYAGNRFFFGADRYATNGTAYIGFWLLQGSINRNPNGTFSGHHVVGDILILSDFTQGGGVSTIKVFKWVGTGGSDGSLDSLHINPSISYAVVNSAAQSSPWPYRPKGGSAGTFPSGAFFEGGADLTALGITGCFTNFLCETRSSASLTAQLKDFVLGKFPASPEVTVNSATVCQGNTAQLCATMTGGLGPFTYSWNTGATTQCINASAAGTYTVLVTGANGCSGQGSGVLTVNPLPTCSITGGSEAICASATTQWCAPVAPAGVTYAYAWTGPGGFTSTTRCITIGAAGQYSLTITDNHNCQSSCNRTLTVYSLPTCSVTGGSNAVCVGGTTEWCAPVAPAGVTYAYAWTGPGGFMSTTRCITIGAAGQYFLTITDSHGCQSSCNRTLTVYSVPVCSITRGGEESDTVCPCSLNQDPIPTNQFCGPAGMASYSWSISGGGKIIGDVTGRCAQVQSDVSCDTSYTLELTIENGNSCSSTCERTLRVVDKSPPTLTYCPPDTVIDCQDLDEFWAGPAKGGKMVNYVKAVAVDGCDSDPSVDYADTGGRPTNWMPRVEESVGSCGEDTTIVRRWYVRDFCGNVDSSCVQVIAIQDTIPPMLVCAAGDTVPCGGNVIFTDPGATDNCDPQQLINLVVVSTDTIPGPGPGQFTHTRCWAASDSCQNLSPVCCQSILVEACPEEFCTFTVGGWGSGCPDLEQNDSLSTQPGCIRDHYFTQVFPNGVLIGDPTGIPGALDFYAAKWTTASAVENFLPADGTPRALRRDVADPTRTPAGVLAGQILALRMNREYSCAGIFATVGLQTAPNCYGTFVVPGPCGKFAGMTVDRFLAIADSAVGGRTEALTPYGATLSDVNFTATCLNKAFDNCDITVYTATSDRPMSQSVQGSESDKVLSYAPVPKEFAVRQSYPNPFNPNVTVVYALPADGRVTIEVYDIVGRKVITLLDEQKQVGYHSAVWFGQDGQGKPVASGVYFCRVQFGTHSAVKKLLLLK